VSLSVIMSHAGLAGYAQVALILFVLVFVAIAWWVFLPAQRKNYHAWARIPLDDEHTVSHQGQGDN